MISQKRIFTNTSMGYFTAWSSSQWSETASLWLLHALSSQTRCCPSQNSSKTALLDLNDSWHWKRPAVRGVLGLEADHILRHFRPPPQSCHQKLDPRCLHPVKQSEHRRLKRTAIFVSGNSRCSFSRLWSDVWSPSWDDMLSLISQNRVANSIVCITTSQVTASQEQVIRFREFT